MFQEIANNPKTPQIAAWMTVAISWIPAEIAKLGTLVGMGVSLALLWLHWRKGKIEYEKARIEADILHLEREERQAAADLRRQAGLPIRRNDDH